MHFETSDFDAALEAFRPIYGDTRATIDKDFLWSVDTAALGPVTLIQSTMSALAHIDITLARHALLISRASSMDVDDLSGSRTAVRDTTSMMASLGKRLKLQVHPGHRPCNLTFAQGFLETQFAALTGETIQHIEFQPEFDLKNTTGMLVDHFCHYLVNQVNAGPSTLPAALTASLCESLSRTLLVGHPHNHSYLLDKPTPPSSRTVVRIVEEYVDANANGPIVADDLARLTGVSVKSIDAAFRQHRQTTPLAFLRQRRLQRARRMLLEDSSIPISQVTHAAGFLRLDSFLSTYFKTFKESPAETRRRGFLGNTSSLCLSKPLHLPTPEARLSLLSERERQVCALVAQGRLNKQIADELGIAERTVKDHRAHALKKLGVDSTAELITLWHRLSK